MSDINEYYKPPEANLEQVADNKLELASRGTRLTAAIADSLIALAVSVPLMMYFGVWDAIMSGNEPKVERMLIIAAVGIIAFLAIHGYFLKKDGQTVGKKLFNIYIVDLNGQVPNFPKLVTLRYLPLWFVSYIPVVGSFLPTVDVLFIFRKDRRCVHDLVAGTKVVTKQAHS